MEKVIPAERVVIACDNQENFIAEALRQYLEGSLKEEMLLECSIYKEYVPGSIILLLCSPYSISSSSTLHSICGTVEYYHEYQRNGPEMGDANISKSVIVPICFSGMSTGGLPTYISANQSLVIPSENEFDGKRGLDKDEIDDLRKQRRDRFNQFGRVLLSTIERHLNSRSKDNNSTVYFDKKRIKYFDLWDRCWNKYLEERSASESEKPEDTVGRDESNFSPVCIDRIESMDVEDSSLVSCINGSLWVGTELGLDNNLNERKQKITDFCKLHKQADRLVTEVSVGVQLFMWDGFNLYLGLKKTANESSESNQSYFHSGTEDLLDTRSLESTAESLQQLDNSGFIAPKPDVDFYLPTEAIEESPLNAILGAYIGARLNSCGHQFWSLEFRDLNRTEPCILLANDSDTHPRIDIGIVRILDVSNSIKEYIQSQNPRTESSCHVAIDEVELGISKSKIDPNNLFEGDWIWAKDGRLRYWFFNKVSDIESYIYSSEPVGGNKEAVFVNDMYLHNRHGLCRAGTPYTSDEDRRDTDLAVQEPFTVAARSLLVCF